MKYLLLAVTLLFTGNVLALDAPNIALSTAGAGRIAVQVQTATPVSGFNVYLNKQYYRTVRPPRGATTFEFQGIDGTYCVVSFDTTSSGTQYSVCSKDVVYVASGTTPAPETSDGTPTPPRNLRSTRYSSTAGEIFWDAASDDGRITTYKVFKDGQLLVNRDARSYFDRTLQPGRTYQFRVVAVDDKALESTGALVTLSASGSNTGTIEAPSSPVTPPPTPPSTPASGFTVQFAQAQVDLREGDDTGVDVAIQLARASADQRVVNLSVQAASATQERNLSYTLDRTSLAAGEVHASLRIKLAVGMAPVRSQTRQLILRASDGRTSLEKTLTLNITPLQAPDVYLLIGQSNMEGYSETGAKQSGSGQPDEPVDRVQQLNVQSNSRTVFRENWQFTDENSNVFAPRLIRAEDPLHEPLWPGQSRKGATFIGPGLSFAKAALPYTSQQIVLVPAAWGGTGFCANANGDLAWNAARTSDPALGGTLLTDRALTRLNMTLRDTGGVWRGIIWHQGGADSNNSECVQTYAENLQKLFAHLRRTARVDKRGASARGDRAAIPLVVATMSKGRDERADFSVLSSGRAGVDAVHRNIASLVPYSDFINNDDLVPPAYPCGQSSCVHFGAAANREQGHRMNAALQRIIANSD